MPRRRSGIEGFSIAVDTRERYGFRFSGRDVSTEELALPAGDYGVKVDGRLIATVERKTIENLTSSLSDGTLSFQMQKLAEVPLAAIVVEGKYSDLFKLEHVNAGWIAEVLSRLQVRYPEVAVIFADSRKFAEEWTYRFLASALSDGAAPDLPTD